MGTKTSAIVGGLGLVGGAASLVVGWLSPSCPWRFAIFGLATLLLVAGIVVIALGFRHQSPPPSPPSRGIVGIRATNTVDSGVFNVDIINVGEGGTGIDASGSQGFNAEDVRISGRALSASQEKKRKRWWRR
jgi:hypothetical protein